MPYIDEDNTRIVETTYRGSGPASKSSNKPATGKVRNDEDNMVLGNRMTYSLMDKKRNGNFLS